MIKVDLQRKLNNNEGKTVLMALFLLLVAIVVSVVIIGAATTAAHQLNDNKDAQQAYLTASSAAELFRDEIVGENGESYTKTVTEYTKTSQYSSAPDKADAVTEPTVSGALKPLIDDVLTKIMTDTTTGGTFEYSPLSNSGVKVESSGIDAFDEVYIDVNVTGGLLNEVNSATTSNYSYSMSITFEVKGEKDKQGYKLSLQIPITKEISKTTAKNVEVPYERTYYWWGETYKYTDYYYYNTTTTTTTVTFDQGTITREGLSTDKGGTQ